SRKRAWEELARHGLDPRRWMASRGQERCRIEAQGADRTRICFCLDELSTSARSEDGGADWRHREIRRLGAQEHREVWRRSHTHLCGWTFRWSAVSGIDLHR